MKRVLVPISFSKSSKNSVRHGSTLYQKSHLTLFHNYNAQNYNRKYDFGSEDYDSGIIKKIRNFYTKYGNRIIKNTTFLASSGSTSDFVERVSNKYDLIVMSRKSHSSKKHGYLSKKKLFITTKSKCPVLIMPITDRQFNFEQCSHIWHIKRLEKEQKIVKKWSKLLLLDEKHVKQKSFKQHSFISFFWHSIVKYQNSHDKKVLKKIDVAHDNEPIDLLIVVDNDESVFTRFFKSDTVKLFCKYDIPILVLPGK